MAGGTGVKLGLAVVMLGAALLAGCGKKGAPTPPGPDNQVTWPRTYPTH